MSIIQVLEAHARHVTQVRAWRTLAQQASRHDAIERTRKLRRLVDDLNSNRTYTGENGI